VHLEVVLVGRGSLRLDVGPAVGIGEQTGESSTERGQRRRLAPEGESERRLLGQDTTVETHHSHGHLKLLHPLPLGLLGLAEELEALLALQVDQVEAVGPLVDHNRGGEEVWRKMDETGTQKLPFYYYFVLFVLLCCKDCK